MGMFDKPQYLTGENGLVQKGDIFWLHNGKLDGKTNVGGTERDQVKLLVSLTKDGEKIVVFSSGTGIVNQIKRMDAGDRAQLPMEVRLDQIASGKGNPTNVMNPANAPEPSASDEQTEMAF